MEAILRLAWTELPFGASFAKTMIFPRCLHPFCITESMINSARMEKVRYQERDGRNSADEYSVVQWAHISRFSHTDIGMCRLPWEVAIATDDVEDKH